MSIRDFRQFCLINKGKSGDKQYGVKMGKNGYRNKKPSFFRFFQYKMIITLLFVRNYVANETTAGKIKSS